MTQNYKIVALLAFLRAYLIVIMDTTWTKFFANARALVVLGYSWVACEVFLLFLVIRGATEALKIIDYVHWLGNCVKSLIDFLLFLSSYLDINSYLECICWCYSFFEKLFLGLEVQHIEDEGIPN